MVNKIILIEGLPGTGKSSVMEELREQNLVVYEFHTERKKITDQFGIFLKNKEIKNTNKKIKLFEDKLEDIILSSRFLSPNKEEIKIKLLQEKIKECKKLKDSFKINILKEGFLGCLIDSNSDNFLENLKKIMKEIDAVIFLKLSERELLNRQIARITNRKGQYNDKTNNKVNKNFLKQFKKITKNTKVIYVSAKPWPGIIAKNIMKSIEKI